ncbi:MAG TPA: hypothetical protein DDW54_02690, partial [Clostridiales bacterium]|nr:hypothetical protein [Clostridiales bacterium]
VYGENIYTVKYNKESECLFLGFDINGYGVTKAFMIAVKGREPQAFGYIDERPENVRITVKLSAGDEFYFLPKEGYGLIVCHESDYFDVNYETGVHTVRENGTYTFTYSESDMRAEKA